MRLSSENRRVILGGLVAALLPAFALTHVVVAQYKDQRQRLADAWRGRGERAFAGDPSAAVLDFQTALAYEDSARDRLRLAEALIAARRPAEARAQLVTLWAEQPGDGRINLELGRLAAAAGDVKNATRYYHGAVDGAWDADAPGSRRAARLELAQFLIARNQPTAAQAELIALGDDLPPDPNTLTEVGTLLVRTGADRHALPLFARALELDPGETAAAQEAGAVAFRARDYRLAQRYFGEAERHGTLDAASRTMNDVSMRVLALDPLARGIAARERARRVREGLEIARARLARCEGTGPTGSAAFPLTDLAARLDVAMRARLRALEQDSDARDEAMTLVFDVEGLPSAGCGAPSIDDQALQLIANEHRASH